MEIIKKAGRKMDAAWKKAISEGLKRGGAAASKVGNSKLGQALGKRTTSIAKSAKGAASAVGAKVANTVNAARLADAITPGRTGKAVRFASKAAGATGSAVKAAARTRSGKVAGAAAVLGAGKAVQVAASNRNTPMNKAKRKIKSAIGA